MRFIQQGLSSVLPFVLFSLGARSEDLPAEYVKSVTLKNGLMDKEVDVTAIYSYTGDKTDLEVKVFIKAGGVFTFKGKKKEEQSCPLRRLVVGMVGEKDLTIDVHKYAKGVGIVAMKYLKITSLTTYEEMTPEEAKKKIETTTTSTTSTVAPSTTSSAFNSTRVALVLLFCGLFY